MGIESSVQPKAIRMFPKHALVRKLLDQRKEREDCTMCFAWLAMDAVAKVYIPKP